jgi:hypothetical protein
MAERLARQSSSSPINVSVEQAALLPPARLQEKINSP